MNDLGAVIGFLILAVGVFILSVFIVMWNVNAIITNGYADFWNIFWILLIAGGGAKAATNK